MIRFIHTADIHFGMENYGRIDQKTGIHSRLLDFDRAFNFCIDTAIEQEVDFFLFSGDAYKTANPSPTQQKLLFQALLRLHKAHIPIVIVIGNHDNPLSFGRANALSIFGQLPLEGFYVIAKPTTIQLKTKNGEVAIVGIPWPTRNTIALSNKHMYKSTAEITEYIAKAVANIIAEQANALDPTIPAVLAAHITVSSGVFSGSEKRAIYGNDPLFLPSQLAIKPFDYVALGHLHRHQNLNPNGYPALIYSGSIERVDFGEHKEDKGFCLVSIKEKGITSYEFIKTPTRPFIQIEVSLKSDENQTDQVLNAIKKHHIKDAIVKILYHVPENKKNLVDIKIIQNACVDALYIVGIIPIKAKPVREYRMGAIKVNMDLQTLLGAYFDTKPELKEKKDDLIQKTLLLAQEQQEQVED
ncbi:MAG: exonuclease subunit SbcD [bacterium]|nr:exonuclease subunit SbcD [bacterium]